MHMFHNQQKGFTMQGLDSASGAMQALSTLNQPGAEYMFAC